MKKNTSLFEATDRSKIDHTLEANGDDKAKEVMKSLQGDFGGDNESQMKGVELLKGLALSDDPKANEFMKKLNKATTAISKEVLGGSSNDKEEKKKKENTLFNIRTKEEMEKLAEGYTSSRNYPRTLWAEHQLEDEIESLHMGVHGGKIRNLRIEDTEKGVAEFTYEWTDEEGNVREGWGNIYPMIFRGRVELNLEVAD